MFNFVLNYKFYTMKIFMIIGALYSFIGILASSLSSHAIKDKLLQNNAFDSFNLAQNLLIIHGIAIILLGFLAQYFKLNLLNYANIGLISGVALFSLTVFIKSMFPSFLFGFLTPVGGSILMLSWLFVIVSFFFIKS